MRTIRGFFYTVKQLEVTEGALKDNSKIIITEKGISPTLLIGELPVRPS